MAGRSRPIFLVDKLGKSPAFVINAAYYNTNLDNRNRRMRITIANVLPVLL